MSAVRYQVTVDASKPCRSDWYYGPRIKTRNWELGLPDHVKHFNGVCVIGDFQREINARK